jgi:hypothetical protein
MFGGRFVQEERLESRRGCRNYSEENISMINYNYSSLQRKYENLVLKVVSFGERMSNSKAGEYFVNGVGRRLTIVHRCVVNIFHIFPCNRVAKLNEDERTDVDINLHAFLINIHGIIENLGLAIAFENHIIDGSKPESQQRREIGLFNKRFIDKVGGEIHEHFINPELMKWYREYAVNFRDALAHRIPAYVPPAGLSDEEALKYNGIVMRLNQIQKIGWTPEISHLLDEIERLGVAYPSYVHSSSEKAKVVSLHPQILSDFLTVEEMIMVVIENFNRTNALT